MRMSVITSYQDMTKMCSKESDLVALKWYF